MFGSPKLPLFARYKFALALENSLAHDYVTEKFYQPLLAGAVPIYLGVPFPHPTPSSSLTVSVTLLNSAGSQHALVDLGRPRLGAARE